MGSPVTQQTLGNLATEGDLCARFQKLLQTGNRFSEFLGWLLDSSGELSDDAVDGIADRLTPVGTIVAWPSNSLPSDRWRVCNGQTITRAQHPKLFQRLGTRYGVGDNLTTFNLPDLRDTFIRGVPLSGTLGITGGDAAVALTAGQTPLVDHFHGTGTMVTSTTAFNNNDFYVIARNFESTESLTGRFLPGDGTSSGTVAIANTDQTSSRNDNVSSSRTGGIGTTNAKPIGNADTTAMMANQDGVFEPYTVQTHNNLPPYMDLFWIIKVL
jgi:microcystin-dependent protein